MVVHRRDGVEHAKVLDFGLAKLRERGPEARGISSGGQVIGTPYYMAPEQVRGEDLDARADIYSLGATLYRVLTGEPPFDAPSPMSVLSKHLTDDVVPPRSRAPGRSLPPDADRIVLRAMAKSVEDRYASAAEVQHDLEHALASPGAEPRSVATVALRRPGAPAMGRATGEAPTLLLGGSARAREHGRLGGRDRRGGRRHGSRHLIRAFDLRGGLDVRGGQRPGSPASLRRRRLRMDAAPATAGCAGWCFR